MQARGRLRFGVAIIVLAVGGLTTSRVRAAVAIPQITDINNSPGFGGVNVFSNPPIGVDDTGVFMNNDIAVYSFVGGGSNNGAGVTISISNGENGIASTDNGNNVDVNNDEPADPVFTVIGNSTGRLENGNVIRFSMWMRQDPNSPVVKEPQIEPVVKIELWKEALSGFADFNAVAFPGFGDRIWDTDQNASNAVFNGFDQSRADWVDVNNDGDAPFGNPVAASLVTDEWRRVETTLLIDDDPLNDGFGWSIGAEFFDVTDVEEVRAVMFVGDFAGTDLTAGGSFWVDNLLLEVFPDVAAMNATPNPNTPPVEMAGVPGDYNNNGAVDAADYTVWRDNLGSATALPNDATAGVTTGDFDTWKTNFGNGAPGAGGLSAGAVPEPTSVVLVALALIGFAAGRRSVARRNFD